MGTVLTEGKILSLNKKTAIEKMLVDTGLPIPACSSVGQELDLLPSRP